MEPDQSERRRAPRIRIEAGATVELDATGRTIPATTVDVGACGALLRFEIPDGLAVGDCVVCEFQLSPGEEQALPHWGAGTVVRIGEGQAALDFGAGLLSPMESKGAGAIPGEAEEGKG